MKTKIVILVCLFSSLISCKNTGRTLPSATGARFELLIVIDDKLWDAAPGHALFNLFDQSTPSLPQPEPMMRISHVSKGNFSNFLKPSRNILYTEISGKHSKSKIIYSRDYYAFPQAFVQIFAPDEAAFVAMLEENGNSILDFFILAERDRTILFNKKDLNYKAVNEVRNLFDIQVDIPVDLKRSVIGEDFYWITNDNSHIRQDLIIYSYPYTDKNTFTYEYLTAKRDSVLKNNIPGETEGSYMGTEYKYVQPVMKEITVNGEYGVEIRGLWKVLNGASMGGPYYSLTRLDEVNQRVVTVEGFVFAPSTKKRNAIRMLEAIVHSTRLNQDLNVLGEVSVTVTNPEEKVLKEDTSEKKEK